MSRIGVRHCSKWFMSRLKNIQAAGKRIKILSNSTNQISQKKNFCRILKQAQARENV